MPRTAYYNRRKRATISGNVLESQTTGKSLGQRTRVSDNR